MESQPTRVLVVHRNQDLAPRIRQHLGCLANVDLTFADGWPGSSPGGCPPPDVILLDLTAHLPEGYELYRLIQPHGAALPPVLMLRARPTSHQARAAGGISTVESRLQTALGRVPHGLPSRTLRHVGAHLVAELPNGHVLVDGREVVLSVRETEVLGALLAHCNRVVPRSVLFAEIWGYETRALDVNVGRLRRKLGPAGAQLETVAALGYRFAESDSTAAATADPSPRSRASARLPVVGPPHRKETHT